MSAEQSLAGLAVARRNELETLLMEFDQDWRPDLLPDFFARLESGASDDYRRLALLELVKIDLQRRWAAGVGQLLEEYLSRFPALGRPGEIAADLILVEYDARRSVDPGLTLQGYRERFPEQFAELSGLAEQARESGVGPQASIETSRIACAKETTAPRTRAAEEVPQEFGRYRIIRELGSGAMGTVYLALDTQLDRQVALKTPNFSGGGDDDLVTRFYREARAAATLQHRNICPVYDVGEIDGRHFMSMGFIKGRSLQEFIKPDQLPPPKTAGMLIHRLAGAMAEAHRHNVVHRDLKPANIMIDLQREPVVMDFGLARKTDTETRMTQSGMIVGTPAYMSPEQVTAEQDEVGPAADIYALGVILYELLTGDIPFRGSIAQVVYKITSEEPTPPSEIRKGIDPPLETICAKMMAKRIADRYQSMEEVAADLKAYLKGQPVRAGRTRPLNPTGTAVEAAVDSGDSGISETAALNAYFAAQAAANPLQTAMEPALAPKPAPRSRKRNRSEKSFSKTRSSDWRIKTVAGFSGGVLALLGIIIYFNGGKVELDGDSDVAVEVGRDGRVTIRPEEAGRQSAVETIQPGPAPADIAARGEIVVDGRTTINTLGGITSMAVSPDGRYVAGAAPGVPSRISIWNTQDGQLVKRITRPDESFAPDQLAFAPNGEWILYSSGMTCRMVNVDTGQERSEQEFPAPPAVVLFPRSSLAMALYHELDVHRTERDEIPQRLRIWNWETSDVLYEEVLPIQQGTPLTHPSVSPDERFVTFGWGHYYVRHELSNEGTALGQRSTFERLIRVRGPLVFTPDVRYAAASVKSGEFLGVILDVESGSVLHHLDPETAGATNQGHEFGCNLAFSADGSSVVMADHNGRISLWDVRTGELITELGWFHAEGNHDPPEVAVTVDDRVIVAGDHSDSRITIQRLTAIDTFGGAAATPPGRGAAGRVLDHALAFDGVDDRVDIESFPELTADEYTVEAIVRTEAGKGVVFRHQDSSNRILTLNAFDHAVRAAAYDENGIGGSVYHEVALDPQQAVHLAMCVQNGQVRLYLDGEPVGSFVRETGHEAWPPQNATIGGFVDAPEDLRDLHLHGMIDELRISSIVRYDRPFEPPARHQPDRDTLALYHFDSGEGEVLIDSSSNGLHGRILGATWNGGGGFGGGRGN